MHTTSLAAWTHDHSFGQEQVKAGERRTRLVIALTGIMMVVEIIAGVAFGSMALLADGMHMASHAAALAISATAYLYARKYAHDGRFSFGTGKVNGLAGFTSAIILAIFALSMAWQSLVRFFNPHPISFNQAIFVACIGLMVNLISVWILNTGDSDSHAETDAQVLPAHAHSDHNLRAAYLHVLADAMTSIFAILALFAGKYLGLVWMDPLMGLVGAMLVGRWSIGLIRVTSQVLLDQQAPGEMQAAITASIESRDDNRVCDLHLWSIGPGIFAAAISIVTSSPKSPEAYKALLPEGMGLVHATVEVHLCKPN